MKNSTLTKTNGSKCRRMIVIAEINNLRKREDRLETDIKIGRQMSKLHSLWFKGV